METTIMMNKRVDELNPIAVTYGVIMGALGICVGHKLICMYERRRNKKVARKVAPHVQRILPDEMIQKQ